MMELGSISTVFISKHLSYLRKIDCKCLERVRHTHWKINILYMYVSYIHRRRVESQGAIP